MPRAPLWRNAPLALLLLAATACTGSNPRYDESILDAADDPRLDATSDTRDTADAPADAAPTEVEPADAPIEGPPADAPVEATMPDVPGPGPAALGAACTAPGGCQSGFCVDGVCCASDCRERCRSCALAGTLGTCSLIPVGADPRLECPAQDPSTCGRAGACDGKGDCQLHPVDTECQARTCSGGVEVSAARCNGTGTCTPGTPTACALAECADDRCSVGCTTTCPTGYQCQAGKCAGAGPALHWRFDETSGAMAIDSSPNAFTGFYRGEGGVLPTPSMAVSPGIKFLNPRSLAFTASGRTGVQLTAVTPVLRPTTAVTISLWYRATTTPSDGANLVNLGDDYFIRLKASDIEMAKHRSNVLGQLYQLATARNLVGHLDGNWHHVAGVISATSVSLYYDGRQRVTKPNSDPILYGGAELWAGRDADGEHRFQGGLDDVRIYTRDLSQMEIEQLAAGQP